MLIYKKMARYRTDLAGMLCAALIISIFGAPSLHINSVQRVNNTPRTTARPGPMALRESSINFIEETSMSEILGEIERSYITNRYIRRFQSTVLRILNILLPFAEFCVLVYCFGYFNRKKYRQESVMALSMGGHAPPQTA